MKHRVGLAMAHPATRRRVSRKGVEARRRRGIVGGPLFTPDSGRQAALKRWARARAAGWRPKSAADKLEDLEAKYLAEEEPSGEDQEDD